MFFNCLITGWATRSSIEEIIQVVFHDEVIGTINLNNFDGVLEEAFNELHLTDAWNQVKDFFIDNGPLSAV